MKIRLHYIVTAREYCEHTADRGVRIGALDPLKDAECVYDGYDPEEARAAAEEFIAEHSCEVIDHEDLSCAFCYWKTEGFTIEEYENGEEVDEWADVVDVPELALSSETEEARNEFRELCRIYGIVYNVR